MLKIVTRAEYDSASKECQELFDALRRMHAERLMLAPEVSKIMTLEDAVASVTKLHENGFLALVHVNDDVIQFVPSKPCQDGIHCAVVTC